MTTPTTITVPERYAAHLAPHALGFYEDEGRTPLIRMVRGVVKVDDPDFPNDLDFTTYYYRGRCIWQNDTVPRGYGGRWVTGKHWHDDSLEGCKRHIDRELAKAEGAAR